VNEPHRPLLCFLVDAFRHDYLNQGETPFFASLAADGLWSPLPTILGYSDAIRATIFTGRYPDQLGYWIEYCFRPERSPFRPLDRLGFVDRFPNDFAQRGAKYVLSATLMRALARSRGYRTLDLRHLPFGALRFFDYTLPVSMTAPGALAAPTIFDRLSDAGLRWVYLDSSTTRPERMLGATRDLHVGTALVLVYLHHGDMASHLFGLESDRFRRSLRMVDGLAARLHEAVRLRMGQPSVLVFSDHGMSRAGRMVAIPELRRHPAFGTGFCFALDATMVRLWYFRDDARFRDDLRSLVAYKLPGRFLNESDRVRLHIDFDNRHYGDDIFLTEPGTVIFPNFHSYVRPKAMHAYDPADPDQDGIFIASKEITERPINGVNIADIAPLALDLVGVHVQERAG